VVCGSSRPLDIGTTEVLRVKGEKFGSEACKEGEQDHANLNPKNLKKLVLDPHFSLRSRIYKKISFNSPRKIVIDIMVTFSSLDKISL
jgi:hypothetical protein